MAYTGDQLQSVDPTKPLDTDPESSIGQVLRDLKAAILGWVDVEHWRTGKHKRWFGPDTGTANTYQVTIQHEITVLDAGLALTFIAKSTNTGASTLEVIAGSTSLGAVAIQAAGSPVAAGYIAAGSPVELVYDGANWQMINAPTSVTITGLTAGNLTYITGSETVGATAVPTVNPVLLGSITVPVNPYSKLLIEAGVQLYNPSNVVTASIVPQIGGTNLTTVSTDVKGSGYLTISQVTVGGQTSAAALNVYSFLAATRSGFTATLVYLRVYGIA